MCVTDWIIRQRSFTEYRTPQLGFSYNLGLRENQWTGRAEIWCSGSKYMIRTTLLSLKQLVAEALDFKDLSGPVGLLMRSERLTKVRAKVLMLWMNLVEYGSISVQQNGVMNLLLFRHWTRRDWSFWSSAIRNQSTKEVEEIVHCRVDASDGVDGCGHVQ